MGLIVKKFGCVMELSRVCNRFHQAGSPVRTPSGGFAKLHGHFKSAVGDRPGAHNLAEVAGGGVAIAVHVELAVLSNRQRLAQQERYAAELHIPRQHFVPGVGEWAVEHGQCGLALERLAHVAAPIAVGETGQRHRFSSV